MAHMEDDMTKIYATEDFIVYNTAYYSDDDAFESNNADSILQNSR